MTTAKITREDADRIAISALAFIAGDAELLPRFLALTGIDATMIRSAAKVPGFLAGVLNFVAAHEPTLMQFAAHADLAPETIGNAARMLPSGDDTYERSV